MNLVEILRWQKNQWFSVQVNRILSKSRGKDGRKVRRASKACGETLSSYVYTKWKLRRGEGRGDKFEEIMAENLPDLTKNNLWIQEAQQTPSMITKTLHIDTSYVNCWKPKEKR